MLKAGWLAVSCCIISFVCLSTGWEVKDDTDAVCLLISGTVTLQITYTDPDNTTVVNTTKIPDDSGVSGTCSTGDPPSSTITLTWDTYQLTFNFGTDIDIDEWKVSSAELNFKAQDISLDPLPVAAHSNAFYECASSKEFTLAPLEANETTISSVVLTTSNLTIQPFPNLLRSEICSADPVPTDPPEPKPDTTQPQPEPVPTDPKPEPTEAPVKNVTSGSKVFWVCSFISLTVIGAACIVIYVNRAASPSYLQVV